MVNHIPGHPWVLRQATGTSNHKTHHGPNSRVCHYHTPYSIVCDAPWGLRPNGTNSRDSRNGVPKLSRNRPGGVPGLWELITPDYEIGSRRGLNQTCSPRRDLSNDVSHSQFGLREEVDSRLLVVGSQIASLTPGPSFAHNLGDRCPNAQCEAIFDIYASRPFQWHQEHLNARCFGPCCRALNIRESRRTSNPELFQVLGFTPTLGQVRVATSMQPHITPCKVTYKYTKTNTHVFTYRERHCYQCLLMSHELRAKPKVQGKRKKCLLFV